jgi:hypothetical protein
MGTKKFSRIEIIAISIASFLFLSISLIVVFKREWLDNFFFGPTYYVEYYYEDEQRPLLSLDIVPSGDNKASVILYFESEVSITGAELYLEKDSNLKINDFVCNAPFECLFSDSTDSEFSVAAIVPIGSVEPFAAGQVLLGEIEYSGNGKLYISPSSKSFASDVNNPEANILDLTLREFAI